MHTSPLAGQDGARAGREESLPGSLAESSEILNSDLLLQPQLPLGNLKCDAVG